MERNMKMAMTKVRFSASGNGTETLKFKSADDARRHVERESAALAVEHGGEAVDYGNGEWVVQSSGGEEIARWEIA